MYNIKKFDYQWHFFLEKPQIVPSYNINLRVGCNAHTAPKILLWIGMKKKFTKEHFDEILTAFFDNSITITYSENEKVVRHVLPPLKAVLYFDASFDYYYKFYKYLAFTVHLNNCTKINDKCQKKFCQKKF